MKNSMRFLVGALASAGLMQAAQAAAITTNPGLLTGNGGVSSAVFVFADAGDESQLKLTVAGMMIFDNKTSPIGSTAILGALSGPQDFVLQNLSIPAIFHTNVADATGAYHALITTNYADFGVGSIPSAAQSALASLTGTIIYVGWEDRIGGDYDYNDLIFAFSSLNLPTETIPEPATLALVGASLGGLGLLRRRRAKA